MTPKSWNAVETKHTKHRNNSRFFFFWGGGGVFAFKSIIIQWAMAVQKHHSRNSFIWDAAQLLTSTQGGTEVKSRFFFSKKNFDVSGNRDV